MLEFPVIDGTAKAKVLDVSESKNPLNKCNEDIKCGTPVYYIAREKGL